MPIDSLLALVLLTGAAAWTPGPNNALVASSGANFGVRRSLPHILGIALGFALMLFVVGFFLGGLFQASRLLREALRWGGAAVLLWLAWKIARSGGVGKAGGGARPFTFLEAAAFQWINPKAWAMAIAIPAQFIAADRPVASAAIVAAVAVGVGLSSAASWTVAGQAMTRWIDTEARLRRFNLAMGAIIAACVGLLFIG